MKNGTVNMPGTTGTIQHYIDDGRKPADVPATNVGGINGPLPRNVPGLRNGLGGAVQINPGFIPLPAAVPLAKE